MVAAEFIEDWIAKNVFPLNVNNVAKKIRTDYQRFIKFRKQKRNKSHRKSDEWYVEMNEFNDSMTNHVYDIRTKDKFYQKKLEQQFGVIMTKEDELFYQKNCFGSYTFTCLHTVSRNWSKQKKRVDRRLSSEKKIQLLDDHQTA